MALRLSDSEKQRIIELAPAHSVLSISKLLGRGRETINNFGINNDIEFKPQKVQQDDIDLVIALRNERLTHKSIAEKFEVSKQTIKNILYKNKDKVTYWRVSRY